jgi:hypothetical protein
MNRKKEARGQGRKGQESNRLPLTGTGKRFW